MTTTDIPDEREQFVFLSLRFDQDDAQFPPIDRHVSLAHARELVRGFTDGAPFHEQCYGHTWQVLKVTKHTDTSDPAPEYIGQTRWPLYMVSLIPAVPRRGYVNHARVVPTVCGNCAYFRQRPHIENCDIGVCASAPPVALSHITERMSTCPTWTPKS